MESASTQDSGSAAEVLGVGGRDFEDRAFKTRLLKLLRNPKRVVSYFRRKGGYKQAWDHLGADEQAAFEMVDSSKDDAELTRRGVAVASLLVDSLGIDETHRVVEIGCGPARIGREMAASCKEWIGMDISKEMIRLGKTRTAHLGNVSFHLLEGARLDALGDAAIDRLYCHSVLVHIDKEDMYRYLCEIKRVLAPGGLAYVDTWNILHDGAWSWFENSVSSAPYTGRKESWRPQMATLPELSELIRRAGLREVTIWDDSHLVQAFVTVGDEMDIEAERARIAPEISRMNGLD